MKNGMNQVCKYFLNQKAGMFTIFLFFLLLAGALGNAVLRQAKAKSAAPPPPANDVLWQDVNRLLLPRNEADSPSITRSARTLRLNREMLARTLSKAPLETSGATTKGTTHETLLSLPLPAGGFAQFRLEASPVLPPTLAAKYPQIQSYRGEGVGVAATMRCDWSPRGFYAAIMHGNQLINIHPLTFVAPLTISSLAPNAIQANNPIPTDTSLVQASVVVGGPGFNLTDNGTNFVNVAVGKFNRLDRITTFVSATQLMVALTAGQSASLFFVSPTQINYLHPDELKAGLATVSITNVAGIVTCELLQIERVAPALFTADVQYLRGDGSEHYDSITTFDTATNCIVGVSAEVL